MKRLPASQSTRLALCLPVILVWLSAPAKADIWGYVDAERVPHFASRQLDDRYELLLRDSQALQPYSPMYSGPSPDTTPVESLAVEKAEVAQPTASSEPSPLAEKYQIFFERSASYKAVSPLLLEASRTHGVDYSLLKAVITAESGFNPVAVSPKGAVGLMQLIPPTATRYGVTASKNSTVAKKLTDPRVNIKAGARYLADLMRMFPGRLELALAAYNAGEGAVQRAGNKIPNYPETQNYVKTVMNIYTGLGQKNPAPLAAPAK